MIDISNKKISQSALALFVIVAFGFMARAFAIGSTPPGIYTDEAYNGLDAIRAMQGDWRWFYEANNGREGLFINLIAASFKIFGVGAFALRLPAMLFGTAAILGTYLLSKELFQSKRVGLISAFMTAFSFWALNFSRISFRAVMLPAILVFTFYFLWKGLSSRKWHDFAIGGFIFGLGMHSYIAFRVAPLILALALLGLMLERKNFWKSYGFSMLIFLIFFLLSASPMLAVFKTHPEYLTSRTNEISIFNPKVNQGDFGLILWQNLRLALAKYVYPGDPNWRHNFPPYGILDPLSGLFFIVGLAFSLAVTVKSVFYKKLRETGQGSFAVYFLLLSWFLVMLIPEVATKEGNPHALRSIGTMPAVFILVAVGIEYFWQKLSKQKNKLIFVGAVLLFVGTFNLFKYFHFWAKNPKTARAFNAELVDMTKYAQEAANGKEIYVCADEPRKTTLELLNYKNKKIHVCDSRFISSEIPDSAADFEVIYTNYRKKDVEKDIIRRFPALKPQKETNSADISYYILK